LLINTRHLRLPQSTKTIISRFGNNYFVEKVVCGLVIQPGLKELNLTYKVILLSVFNSYKNGSL